MSGEGYDKWGSAIVDSTGVIQFQIYSGKEDSQTPFRQILNLGANHDKWERGEEVTIHSAVAVERNDILVLVGRYFSSRHRNVPRTKVVAQFRPVGWEKPKDPWELP